MECQSINILIGYGYHPITTATYLERALAASATVTYVGTAFEARPGFPPSVHLPSLLHALDTQPDLFLWVDSGAQWYFPRGLTDLSCPTACYLIDVHVHAELHLKRAMFFDHAFSAQKDFTRRLADAGHPSAHWLPLACDPEIHHPVDVPHAYDIAFVGSIGPGYERRRRLLANVARDYTLNDVDHTYRPDEMAQIYSAASIGFNCSLRGEINMRVFEAMATGTLLMTDRIGNGLNDLFTDQQHLVLYDDDSLQERVAYYLAHDSERKAIAERGYKEVCEKHTYAHRAEALLSTVHNARGQVLGAPLRAQRRSAIEVAYAELCAKAARVDDTMDVWRRLNLGSDRARATRYVAESIARRALHG